MWGTMVQFIRRHPFLLLGLLTLGLFFAVDTLGREVEKSRGYIARAEGVEQNRISADVSPLAALEG